MVLFLRELAASQSVVQAAASVGMSRQSAYKLRNRLDGTPFALGWEVALEAGLQQLAHAVLDRAGNGVEVPHYYHGELVGTSRHYDERLATWILDNPWKVGRHQVAREYAAPHFDALLERIEHAALDWEEHEHDPAAALADPDLGAAERAEGEAAQAHSRADEAAFYNRSWYAADAASTQPRPRGGR